MLRLSLLIGHRPSAGLYYTLCLQALANKLLPVWLGEIVLVWLLKRFHAVKLWRGAASVALLRCSIPAWVTPIGCGPGRRRPTVPPM